MLRRSEDVAGHKEREEVEDVMENTEVGGSLSLLGALVCERERERRGEEEM